MTTLLIIAVAVVVAYFMVVKGFNLVGAARQTARVGAMAAAELPNATRWTVEEIKLQNKEYQVQVETMGDEYKASFKESYVSQRVESNKRYKDVLTKQKARSTELDGILDAIKAKETK